MSRELPLTATGGEDEMAGWRLNTALLAISAAAVAFVAAIYLHATPARMTALAVFASAGIAAAHLLRNQSEEDNR